MREKKGFMKNLILYGTLTGNTEMVANKIGELLTAAGKEVELKNVNEASSEDIAAVENCLIVASSTWDDGLPCADMVAFLEENPELPSLTGKKLAFFGCGDSNYVKFCGAVDTLEEKFTQLGGQKISDSLKIDGFIETEENQQKIGDFANRLITLL